MTLENQDELITNAVNAITEKMSSLLLQEFTTLPNELQISLILIKSTQLLLANILCQAASNHDELVQLIDEQAAQIKELTQTCAYSGYPEKFSIQKH